MPLSKPPAPPTPLTPPSPPTRDDVTAARTALADRAPAVDANDPAELVDLLHRPLADPALELARTAHLDDIVAAARTAWTALGPDERLVLAFVMYERLTIEQLARVYQIRPESAVERVSAAKAAFSAAFTDPTHRSIVQASAGLGSEIA
ncbi:MAG TPA: hypothetical protein VGC41_26340 [Kofleriaceae bacterium]